MIQRQLTVVDMAEIFRCTPDAIRQRRTYNPSSLPQAYRSGRRIMWNPAVVEAWFRDMQFQAEAKAEAAARRIAPGVPEVKRTRRTRKGPVGGVEKTA